MSNDDYIKNTYGFQDENITIDKFDCYVTIQNNTTLIWKFEKIY